MIAAVCSLLMLLQPYSPVIEDRVCTHEINHVYSEDAKLVLSQHIFWDEDGFCIDWRMLKRNPVRLREGDYLLVSPDGQGAVMRRIRSQAFMESYSQYDPEVEDRKSWPLELRRKLGDKP